jgi:hypothetical protein
MKAANPSLTVGLVGANIAVDPRGNLEKAQGIDFVAGKEYDFAIK